MAAGGKHRMSIQPASVIGTAWASVSSSSVRKENVTLCPLANASFTDDICAGSTWRLTARSSSMFSGMSSTVAPMAVPSVSQSHASPS